MASLRKASVGMAPIEVLDGPHIMQDGTQVRLEVKVKVARPPKVTWKKDDTAVDAKAAKINKERFDTFILVYPIDDFGEKHAGKYTAEVQNGPAKLAVNFDVSYSKPDVPIMDAPPRIGRIRNRLRIKCDAISIDAATVKWFKTNKETGELDEVKEQEFKIELTTEQEDDNKNKTTYILEMINPQEEDAGHYTCEVTNSYGSNTQGLDLEL